MKQETIYTILMIFILGISVPSKAQINKGQILLAGSTSFTTVSMKTSAGSNYSDPQINTQKTLELTPEIGIFVANNLAIGIAVQYTHDVQT